MSAVQGTPEWLAERAGKVTASRIADLRAKTKSGWGASRANYMAQLIAERLTGTPAESYSNAAMQHGTETEPQARCAYEFHTGSDVEQTGFIVHPRIPMSGASPDGRVSPSGLIEIKCPNTATHIETLIGQEVPAKYIQQMQWQMACDGRQFCDFVSFDPRMPEAMRMFVKRITRDDVLIGQIEHDVIEFLAELDEKIAALTKLYGLPLEKAA